MKKLWMATAVMAISFTTLPVLALHQEPASPEVRQYFSSRGQIHGVVTDQKGRRATGGVVQLQDAGTGTRQYTFEISASGEFWGLAASGDYWMSVQAVPGTSVLEINTIFSKSSDPKSTIKIHSNAREKVTIKPYLDLQADIDMRVEGLSDHLSSDYNAISTLPLFVFDRTLPVDGQAILLITSNVGTISISRSSGNQVHIFGQVRTNYGGSEVGVRKIAANPPVKQNGNSIQIGAVREKLVGYKIDYEIEVPENSSLDVRGGAVNITIEGVSGEAKIHTGSGNIHATGLHNGFTVETGSGNIYAEQTGEGFVKAGTGSGNLELRNLRGGLNAHTGSGDIKAGGAPTGDWKLGAGSGNIDLWIGNAPVTLDASTGSGNIHTDREMVTQGSQGRHHVTGKINGGGPTVRIETGSGDIRVH